MLLSAREARVVRAARLLVGTYNHCNGSTSRNVAFAAAWQRLRDAVGDLEQNEQARAVLGIEQSADIIPFPNPERTKP